MQISFRNILIFDKESKKEATNFISADSVIKIIK